MTEFVVGVLEQELRETLRTCDVVTPEPSGREDDYRYW